MREKRLIKNDARLTLYEAIGNLPVTQTKSASFSEALFTYLGSKSGFPAPLALHPRLSIDDKSRSHSPNTAGGLPDFVLGG
jgi:hypothetical protein